MTGIPYFNAPAFDEAAAALRAAGHEVFNPAEHDREVGIIGVEQEYGLALPPDTLRKALRADLSYVLDHAEGIAYLPDSDRSKGATAEVALGIALGLPVDSAYAWLTLEYPDDIAQYDTVLGWLDTQDAERHWKAMRK